MNIISFSLWGDNPKYTIGAIRNAELAKEIYPEWICKFYIGNDVPECIVDELKSLDSQIVFMPDSGWNGMFWRFLAADSNDTIISRDTDSRLNLREACAVDEWLKSDKDFHIMRDHPHHATAILGGMWGARNGILKGISEWIEYYEKGLFDNKWQVDQNFLRDIIYPLIKEKSCVHDEFFNGIDFPVKRVGYEFVGDVFDENDVRHPEFWKLI